jgi:hypothetical protein
MSLLPPALTRRGARAPAGTGARVGAIAAGRAEGPRGDSPPPVGRTPPDRGGFSHPFQRR